MTDTGLQQQVAAAARYDEFFVPALFEEWAGRVAEATRVAPGDRVLDVACGTGVLAREVKDRVGPSGSVVGLDLNPGMLAVAAQREPGITWQEGPAESIPYGDGLFDAVVSQFGLMFFVDRHGALREMWRVLRPRGSLAVAVWDSLENTPAYAAEVELFRRMAGERAAAVLHAPFVLGDPGVLRKLFTAAGIPAPVVSARPGLGRFGSVRAMIDADIKAWLPLVGLVLSEQETEAILSAAEQELSEYVRPDGTVEFASPAYIVKAIKQ